MFDKFRKVRQDNKLSTNCFSFVTLLLADEKNEVQYVAKKSLGPDIKD